MGGNNSTKSLTNKPWRGQLPLNAAYEKELVDEIKKITKGHCPNILLTGPVNAGKSSFINAILSVDESTKVSRAPTGNQPSSWTLQYTAYRPKIRLKDFTLRDTMGIEQTDGSGVHVDDFCYVVNGNVKNNYRFDPDTSISPENPSFRANPEPEDVSHCIIFVISAVDIYNAILQPFAEKIGQLHARLRNERIPRILILTKADLLCEEVKKDQEKMFRSKKVQEAVKYASELFAIEQASIHPVMNYEMDNTITSKQNIPLLLALKQAVKYAVDRIDQDKDDDKIR